MRRGRFNSEWGDDKNKWDLTQTNPSTHIYMLIGMFHAVTVYIAWNLNNPFYSIPSHPIRFSSMSVPSTSSTLEPSTTSSSSSDFWHPPQYLLFESFRSRPGYDLIRRVSETLDIFQLHPTNHIKRIVDLGCGTGKLTLELARHFPSAESIQGCDSSNNMLEKARSEIHKLEDENLKQKISWKLEGFRQLKE